MPIANGGHDPTALDRLADGGAGRIAGSRGGQATLGASLAGALTFGDRRQVAVWVQLLERVEQGPRPAASGLGAAQVPAGCGHLRAGLLAEDVVRQLSAPIFLDPAGAYGGQIDERVAGQLAHPPLGHAEQVGQLVVALALLKHELDDRPLLIGKLVERGHKTGAEL
jgi:hypothetical protein